MDVQILVPGLECGDRMFMLDLNETTFEKCCYNGTDPKKSILDVILTPGKWIAYREVQYMKDGPANYVQDVI